MSDAVPVGGKRKRRSGGSRTADPASLPPDLDDLWRAAQDVWSESIDLKTPTAIRDPQGGIAFINLATRQTEVNFGRLDGLGVGDHLPSILAHEVGHHIRYPHTLRDGRRLMRFLREVATELYETHTLGIAGTSAATEGHYDYLLNIFLDLLINDEISDQFEESFVAVYSALTNDSWGPVFGFYLGMFEELWALPTNSMVPEALDDDMQRIVQHWRRRARSAGEFIRSHPENRPLQLARFMMALRPFVLEQDRGGKQAGEAFEKDSLCPAGQLGGDDVSDLLKPSADEEAARRWLRRAEDGELSASSATKDDPEGTGGGNPGLGGTLAEALGRLQGMADAVEVAIAIYRRSAERTAIEIPRSFAPQESTVPGPLEAWDLGNDLTGLDWTGSVLRAGGAPIPGINTVQRSYLPDEPLPGKTEIPWVEIYIDSSGSMPDPTRTHSHQVEAGFVLAHAAIKAGGRVRIIQYSSGSQMIAMPDFVRSKRPAYEALAQFIGGGTQFPWDELKRSIKKYRRKARIRRVVLSDADFMHNATEGNRDALSKKVKETLTAAAEAGGLTALLDLQRDYWDQLIPPLRETGIEVVRVADWSTVAEVARALSRALFRPDEA